MPTPTARSAATKHEDISRTGILPIDRGMRLSHRPDTCACLLCECPIKETTMDEVGLRAGD